MAAGAVIACALMLLVGCGGSSAADADTPVTRGMGGEISYSVSYLKNGGSGSMGSQSVAPGSSLTLKDNTFTRSGYTFSGWNTAAGGSGTAYASGQTVTPASNLLLYAQWSKQAAS